MILPFGRQKQENYKFKVRLSYFVSSKLAKQKMFLRHIETVSGLCCGAGGRSRGCRHSLAVLSSGSGEQNPVGVGPCGSGGGEVVEVCARHH